MPFNKRTNNRVKRSSEWSVHGTLPQSSGSGFSIIGPKTVYSNEIGRSRLLPGNVYILHRKIPIVVERFKNDEKIVLHKSRVPVLDVENYRGMGSDKFYAWIP